MAGAVVGGGIGGDGVVADGALAVNPTFDLKATGVADAVVQICERLDYSRQQRQTFWETVTLREIAVTEAAHGEIDEALGFFDTTLDFLRRAGNLSSLAIAFTQLAVVFDRIEQPEIAATLFGASFTPFAPVVNLADVRDHVRTVLGDMMFDKCVATGEAMEPADAVHYARIHIEQTRHQLGQSQQ